MTKPATKKVTMTCGCETVVTMRVEEGSSIALGNGIRCPSCHSVMTCAATPEPVFVENLAQTRARLDGLIQAASERAVERILEVGPLTGQLMYRVREEIGLAIRAVGASFAGVLAEQAPPELGRIEVQRFRRPPYSSVTGEVYLRVANTLLSYRGGDYVEIGDRLVEAFKLKRVLNLQADVFNNSGARQPGSLDLSNLKADFEIKNSSWRDLEPPRLNIVDLVPKKTSWLDADQIELLWSMLGLAIAQGFVTNDTRERMAKLVQHIVAKNAEPTP